MAELERSAHQHPAVAWGEMLMGQTVLDRAGRHLGVVEAVATSGSGRLRRIGVRANRDDDRITFFGVEGAEMHLEHIVLPIDTAQLWQLEVPLDAHGRKRFRLFFDRRRKALLRTR